MKILKEDCLEKKFEKVKHNWKCNIKLSKEERPKRPLVRIKERKSSTDVPAREQLGRTKYQVHTFMLRRSAPWYFVFDEAVSLRFVPLPSSFFFILFLIISSWDYVTCRAESLYRVFNLHLADFGRTTISESFFCLN